MEVEGSSDQLSHLGDLLLKRQENPIHRLTVFETAKEEEEEEESDLRKSNSENERVNRNSSLAAPN